MTSCEMVSLQHVRWMSCLCWTAPEVFQRPISKWSKIGSKLPASASKKTIIMYNSASFNTHTILRIGEWRGLKSIFILSIRDNFLIRLLRIGRFDRATCDICHVYPRPRIISFPRPLNAIVISCLRLIYILESECKIHNK